MKNNQKGFGTVELIIVLVVVGLLGFAGWYVWQKNNKSDDSQNNQATTQNDQEQTAPQETPTPEEAPANNDGFLVLEAWGVKLPLRDYDKVQIEIKNQDGRLDHASDYEAYAEPSFKAGVMQDKTCTAGLNLYRSKSNFPDFQVKKKIGDYYYVTTGSPFVCNNAADQQINARFVEDFSSAKLIAL